MADLGPASDLTTSDAGPPDLNNPCEPGSRYCGYRCIPMSSCCVNAECLVNGQTCQNDGTCACPAGEKPCGPSCIAETSCCSGADCTSKVCAGGVCQPPTCSDGVHNGAETDVDCGGANCLPCALGRVCIASADCRSNVCAKSLCVAPGFSPALFIGGVAMPYDIASGDLNGDGKLDVVVAAAATSRPTASPRAT